MNSLRNSSTASLEAIRRTSAPAGGDLGGGAFFGVLGETVGGFLFAEKGRALGGEGVWGVGFFLGVWGHLVGSFKREEVGGAWGDADRGGTPGSGRCEF